MFILVLKVLLNITRTKNFLYAFFFYSFPILRWAAREVTVSFSLSVCMFNLFVWMKFLSQVYIWRASLRCDISYVLWDWVGFSLSFHIVYMNKVFISSTNLKWVFRCHILSENECSFGSLWTYYERIFETLWPCNLNHHPLGGGGAT